MWPFLLAQAAAHNPAIPGVSGWVGAGLLGMVLGWLLMKHLPEKDAQIERMIERHRLELAAALTQQRADSLAALVQILERHKEQTATLVTGFEELKHAVLTRKGPR